MTTPAPGAAPAGGPPPLPERPPVPEGLRAPTRPPVPEGLPAAPVSDPADVPSPVRRRRGRGDVVVLAIVGILFVAAVAAGVASLYRALYSPTAFVGRYLDLLASGDAAGALAVPGVAVDSAALEAAGLPPTASEALLRRAALAALGGISPVSEQPGADTVSVRMAYEAGGRTTTSEFVVEQDGWIGVVPRWRFAQSPLAVVSLTVTGSTRFAVNGFEVDERQVSPGGVDADPATPVDLLVFSPGAYRLSVDTPIAATPGVTVLADAPLASIPVELQAQPTDEFLGVVQDRVEEFLTTCATQQVLQPTGCPFGFSVQNRVVDQPAWSITTQPTVTVVADGDDWRIRDATAVAHIEVTIRSLSDGSVRTVSEDVPFDVNGTIDVLGDGTASIRVGGG